MRVRSRQRVRPRAQVRVFSASEALSGLGVRPAPIAAHRLSAKLSSLAWSPALAGVVTVGDYDGSVVQACITHLRWILSPCLSLARGLLPRFLYHEVVLPVSMPAAAQQSCAHLHPAGVAGQCGDRSLAD